MKKNKSFRWLGAAIAIGTGVGVAIGNLAIGVAVGVAVGVGLVGRKIKKSAHKLEKKESDDGEN